MNTARAAESFARSQARAFRSELHHISCEDRTVSLCTRGHVSSDSKIAGVPSERQRNTKGIN